MEYDKEFMMYPGYINACDMTMSPYMGVYDRGQIIMPNQMNPYLMKNIESIESLYGKTYKTLMKYVRKTMTYIASENMGMVPKVISKDAFNKYLNDMTCEVAKYEAEIKNTVNSSKQEQEENTEDRDFCPGCNGLLKDMLAILLVKELMGNGCKYCR